MIGWLLGVAFATPLTERAVLEALETRVPTLARAASRVEQAEGRLLSARGSFDPRWDGGMSVREGYYPSTRASVGLSVDTVFGPSISAGYRLGVGEFAVYDGKAETLDAGEVGVRVDVPVTELAFSGERARLLGARWGVEEARSSAEDVLREVRLKASGAYWTWVESGRVAELYDRLLERAELRDEALSFEVEAGSLPRVDRLDNLRVIASRRSKAARGNAKLVDAAQNLGLWLRGPEGSPAPPSRDRLPPPSTGLDHDIEPLEVGLARALADRPDIGALDARLNAADVEVRRTVRTLLPQLSVQAGASRDLGRGPESKGELELAFGASVSGSLLWRRARGDLLEARAGREALRAERRWLEDAVVAEVVAAHARWEASAESWEAALEAQRIAEELLELETRRVELGGSDVFRLVLREEALLAAGIEVACAEADWHRARARWVAVTSASPWT